MITFHIFANSLSRRGFSAIHNGAMDFFYSVISNFTFQTSSTHKKKHNCSVYKYTAYNIVCTFGFGKYDVNMVKKFIAFKSRKMEKKNTENKNKFAHKFIFNFQTHSDKDCRSGKTSLSRLQLTRTVTFTAIHSFLRHLLVGMIV
jgi:hypothetical protein